MEAGQLEPSDLGSFTGISGHQSQLIRRQGDSRAAAAWLGLLRFL